MSHSNMWSSLLLVSGCTLSLSACSMSDNISPQSLRPRVLSESLGVSRSGVEGLRDDLAWARSIAQNPAAQHRLTRISSTWASVTSADDLVAHLQAELASAEANAASSRQMSSTSVVFSRAGGEQSAALAGNERASALSPSSPRYDYEDQSVSGFSLISADSPPTNTRMVGFHGNTSCYLYGNSMTIAALKADLKMSFGGVVFWQYDGFRDSGVQYVTGRAYTQVWGDAISATMVTRHTCEHGWFGNYPYKMTSAAKTV